MSRALPGALLVRSLQRQIREQFYKDQALLLIPTPTGAYDSYNNAVVTTTEVPVDCSFTDTLIQRDVEQWKDWADIETVDAQLRYAGPVPQKGWKVKLVSRFDATPYRDEREYEIVAIQNRGQFGFVVALKAITV